jgi:hypothetical protein
MSSYQLERLSLQKAAAADIWQAGLKAHEGASKSTNKTMR